jgi:hypothetical protein
MPATTKPARKRSEPEKKQIEHGRAYTRITLEHGSKLLILRSVRVLARDKGQV